LFPDIRLLLLAVPWLRKNVGFTFGFSGPGFSVQYVNGGSAAAGVVGAVVGVVIALDVRALVVSGGVVGAVVGVVVAFGAAALGAVGVVVMAADRVAAGVGAPAGDGAPRDKAPMARQARSANQTRDVRALRPSLSRRLR
jgi:hypothetical protein